MSNRYYPFLLILIFLGFSKVQQAQECDANFSFTFNTGNSMQVHCVPNGLATSSLVMTEWFLDGAHLSYGTELHYNFAETGNYTLCLKVLSASYDSCIRCIPVCIALATSPDSAVTSISLEKQFFQVSPNPANDHLLIQFNNNKMYGNATINIKIVDVIGRVMKDSSDIVVNSDNQVKIDIADFPKGLYFLKIKNELDFTTQSFKFNKR